jgi:Zn-finger nucleic acid-binding protein
MAAARCYECSSCGGLVREASRRCNYCGSPVATVRCGRCFMMNIPEAIHCIGCGAELGLMPIDQEGSDTGACPRCRTRHLDAFESNDGKIYDCPSCGGQFIPHSVLKELLERYRSCELALPQRLRPHNPLTEKVTYLPCPQCRELMLRRNFGRISGVIVDVCSVHGIWFDVGEVPRILGFIAQGGIRLGEAIQAEEQRARASLQMGALDAPSSVLAACAEPTSWDDAYEAVRSFVEWARQMLR